MTNKTDKLVAWGMTITLATAVVSELANWNNDLDGLMGVGLYVFGIWAVVKLFSMEARENELIAYFHSMVDEDDK